MLLCDEILCIVLRTLTLLFENFKLKQFFFGRLLHCFQPKVVGMEKQIKLHAESCVPSPSKNVQYLYVLSGVLGLGNANPPLTFQMFFYCCFFFRYEATLSTTYIYFVSFIKILRHDNGQVF